MNETNGQNDLIQEVIRENDSVTIRVSKPRTKAIISGVFAIIICVVLLAHYKTCFACRSQKLCWHTLPYIDKPVCNACWKAYNDHIAHTYDEVSRMHDEILDGLFEKYGSLLG